MSWTCNFSKSENCAPSHNNSADDEKSHLMTSWLSPPTVIECKKQALSDHQGDFQVETEFTPLNGAAHVRSYSQLAHPIISSTTTGRENPMVAPTLIHRATGRGRGEATQSDFESDTGQRLSPRGDYLRSSRASISLGANLEDRHPNTNAGTPLNDSNPRTAPFLTLWPLAVLIFYSEFSPHTPRDMDSCVMSTKNASFTNHNKCLTQLMCLILTRQLGILNFAFNSRQWRSIRHRAIHPSGWELLRHIG
jgi:hypothetical protein